MRLIRGCLARLVLIPVFGVAVLYAVIAITEPWAFHIGGRSTPLLYWHGYGRLLTKSGAEYPLYVIFYPKKSSVSSGGMWHGHRSSGDVQGSATLCTAPGAIQHLELSGTMYSAWSTTEDGLMDFRMFEARYFNVQQQRGYFDLAGGWRGPVLALDRAGQEGNTFRSGLRIEGATATLNWGSYADFEAACERATKSPLEK